MQRIPRDCRVPATGQRPSASFGTSRARLLALALAVGLGWIIQGCSSGSSGSGGGGGLSYMFSDLRVGFAIASVMPTVVIPANAYSITAGELPAGLELDATTGVISGRPLAATDGPQAVTIEATDGTSTVSVALAINVAPPPASRFLLATNSFDDTLSVTSLDSSNGFLRHENYAPTGDDPLAVAIAPDGSFVYTANSGSDDVSAFALDTTGELTEVPGSPFASSSGPLDVAVDPLLRFAYVLCADFGTPVVHMYTIAGNGALAPLATATILAGSSAERIAVEPLGRFAYVTFGGAAGMLQSFSIDAMTGALSAGVGALAGDTPRAVAARPGGEFVYVANAGSDDVVVYSIDALTGEPTQVGAVVPLSGGTAPEDLAITADGDTLLVALSSGAVQSFAIAAGGTLTSNGTFASVGASRVAVDHGGDFAFALDQVGNELALFDVAANGTLSLQTVERMRLRGVPSDLVMVPGLAPVAYRTSFLYASNFVSEDLDAFTVGANGSLAPLALPAVSTGMLPNWLEVHPRIPALYSVSGEGFTNAVEVFELDAAGVPTSVQMVGQNGTSSWSLHFDPSGRFAYGTNSSAGEVIPYTVAADGMLTANGSPFLISAVSSPGAGAVDPTGRFLYVPRSNDDTVQAFDIDPVAGTISPIASAVATEDVPLAVAVDPTGRFAYVACFGAANAISAYTIHVETGELTELASSPFFTSGDPIDLVASPDGRRLYVSNRGVSPSVQTFTIDVDSANATDDGALASVNVRALAAEPYKIRLGGSGRVLYVAHAATAGAVQTFALDANGIPGPIDLDTTGDTTQGLAVLTALE